MKCHLKIDSLLHVFSDEIPQLYLSLTTPSSSLLPSTVTSTITPTETALPTQYKFDIDHTVSSIDFQITSSTCLTFLATASLTVYRQVGENQDVEFDIVLSTVDVPLTHFIEGTELKLNLPFTDVAERKAKQSDDELVTDPPSTETGASPSPPPTSPSSLINLTFTSPPSLADFAYSSNQMKFTIGSLSNCPASFGVTPGPETDNANYEARINELLEEEKEKFEYKMEFYGVGDVSFENCVLREGVVSWEKIQEEEPIEEELNSTYTDGESPSSPPQRKPVGNFNLTFNAASSSPVFLTRKAVRSLKQNIRKNQKLKFKIMRCRSEVTTELGESESASASAANDAAAFEDTIEVSLDKLLVDGTTSLELIGSLSTNENSLVSVLLSVSSPLVVSATNPSFSPSSVFSPAYRRPPFVKFKKNTSRDMYAEMATQLDSTISTLVENYAQLFLLNETASATFTKEEKMKRLLYDLNRTGSYYKIKESLKPCLQRIVAVRDGRAPDFNSPAGNVYVGELFEFLLSEINNSLNRMFVTECVIESRESIQNDICIASNIPEKIVKLKMLAEDAEGNARFGYAEEIYGKQIEMAKIEANNERHGWRTLQKALSAHAEFCLTRDDSNTKYLNIAKQSLEDALSLCQTDVENKLLLAAIYLECSNLKEAKAAISELYAQQLPRDENNDGYDTDTLASESGDNSTLLAVFEAILHHQKNEVQAKRMCLRIAERSAQKKGSSTNNGRHTIISCLEAADYFLQYNLCISAGLCISWSQALMDSARLKCEDIGVPEATPASIRRRMSVAQANYHFLIGDLKKAKKIAMEAEKRNKGHFNAGSVCMVLAHILLQNGEKEEALIKYLICLELIEKPIPFKIYCNAAKLLVEFERYEEAREIYFQAADTWRYSSVWLGIGSTSIKLGYLEDAEDALQEANGADTHDDKVWGYFAIVCLMSNSQGRLKEANNALTQALRLNLSDVGIIRELGELFLAIDQRVQAEHLFARGIQIEGGEVGEFEYKLGTCLEKQNEYERALAIFDTGAKFECGTEGAGFIAKCASCKLSLKSKLGHMKD